MNIERSFNFAFRGQAANKKLILGGLFSLLFFTVYYAFVVVGYAMHALCDALEGRDVKLPEWSDHKGLFNEGLVPCLIMLVYFSPCIILSFIEIQLGSLARSSAGIFGPIQLIILILISLFLPLALIRSVITGTFRSAFEFGKIVAFIKTNAGTYLTAWGLAMAVTFGALLIVILGLLIASGLYFMGGDVGLVLGLTLATVVTAFVVFITSMISLHLYAQAYRGSTPFVDDQEGAVRSSMAVPPPLHG